MRHDDILKLLVDEALEDRETGWLSDLSEFDLDYDTATASIQIGWGSIDVGHLASIVLELLEGHRS